MIRILLFIIAVVALTFGATQLIGVSGETILAFGDTRINAPSWAIIMLLIFFSIAIVLTTLIVSGLLRMPKSIARKGRESRREKGLIALTRGLEAVAAGDPEDAQRHAKIASRQLKSDASLTRLLTAQAAQLAGDEETAEASYAAMLEAPETEFLGLRGLYLQAIKIGDKKEAREFAERAFRLRPGTEWAYQSVYGLHLDRGAWGDARDALMKAQQHNLEEGESARRREAALLTAMAYAADTGGDTDTARREASEALRKAPGFAPAAVLAARLEGQAGRRSKAGKLLDAAWAVIPHPAIAKTMADLYKDESLERRAERLQKLANNNPGTDESQILLAEQENALGQHAEARDRLEPLLTRTPRARTFAAMAAAMRGLYGDQAAQAWQDKAAASPLDPVPGADGDFHFTTDGWRRLIREYGDHARMAPPPLEELRTSLTVDEVRLLLAPPIATHEEPPAPEEPIIEAVVMPSEDQAEEDTEEADAVAAAESAVAEDIDPVEDQQAVDEAPTIDAESEPETEVSAAASDTESEPDTETPAEDTASTDDPEIEKKA